MPTRWWSSGADESGELMAWRPGGRRRSCARCTGQTGSIVGVEPGAGGRSGCGRTPARACAAALVWGRQLHDGHSGDEDPYRRRWSKPGSVCVQGFAAGRRSTVRSSRNSGAGNEATCAQRDWHRSNQATGTDFPWPTHGVHHAECNYPRTKRPMLRKPVEASRFAYGLMTRAQKSTSVADASVRATALSKSRFFRLPQEPEDARVTGVTRSLHRRLLGLNLQGSRMQDPDALKTMIA